MEKVSESEMQRRRDIWINTPLTKLINADDLLSDNFVYIKPSKKHNDITIRESINNDISNKNSIKEALELETDKSILNTTTIQNQRVILNLDDDLPF